MKKLIATLISGVMLVLGCSHRKDVTVDYDIYRYPPSGLKDIQFLGITKSKSISNAVLDRVSKALQDCTQYQKVNRLGKSFDVSKDDKSSLESSLKSTIGSYQDARYVHGLLLLDTLKNVVNRSKTPASLVSLKDDADHAWTTGYGYTANAISPLFITEEIAPKTKSTIRPIEMQETARNLSFRMVLYNRPQEAIVIDKKIDLGIHISTFSSKPRISQKLLENALMQEMIEQISSQVCPKVSSVTRHLYGHKSKAVADLLVLEGIDFANDGQWEKAADKWRKAILNDRKNTYAYHNLGIYYERQGIIPSAMEEFAKARDHSSKDYAPPLYNEALSIYLPKIDLAAQEPRIYTASGSHWINIVGGDQSSLTVGRDYPVYRIGRKQTRVDDSKKDIAITEVGRITIVAKESSASLARLTQFVEPFGVESGDVVMTSAE